MANTLDVEAELRRTVERLAQQVARAEEMSADAMQLVILLKGKAERLRVVLDSRTSNAGEKPEVNDLPSGVKPPLPIP